MSKSSLALLVAVAAGLPSAASASPTTASETPVISKSQIIVAQNADNKGVRDWAKAGAATGQGKKPPK